MKKSKLLIFGIMSLLLASCGNTTPQGKAYDPYIDRYQEGVVEIENTYKGDKKDFYLHDFYPSHAGGVIKAELENDEYHVTYNKSSATNYANISTPVIGRFSDFTYLNIHAKGNLGQPLSIRAFYDVEDNYRSNVFGGDTYISVDSTYKTYSLKVKKTYRTVMDLLYQVAIYPELGQASAGEFYFDKIWFSTSLPEDSIWVNDQVDSGGSSIIVNGWETFTWTNYNLFQLSQEETGLKYVKAGEWANVQHRLTSEEETQLAGPNNAFRFTFKDNVDILGRKTISTITFKLVGDKIGEGVTEDGYSYNIYQEYVMSHYITKNDYETHVNEDGYVVFDVPFSSALTYIGDLHQDGYYFSMLIESDPGYKSEYQFNPDGDMVFKSLSFSKVDEEIELYSQGSGEYQSLLSDKEGVEKNIQYTSMPAQTYWPRVERLVIDSSRDSVIKMTIRNNSDHEVKIGAHAGTIDPTRSDAKNNNFFPLWSYGAKNADGYFTDGQNYILEAEEVICIEIQVDYVDAHEDDKITVIQLLIDNCWANEEMEEIPDFNMYRTGDIDVVSVEQ